MSMEMVVNVVRLPGGIVKPPFPTALSRVVPCLVNKVDPCAITMFGMAWQSKIGNSRSICLVSSTCVTEHNIQGLVEPVFTAALLRKLRTNMIYTHTIPLE